MSDILLKKSLLISQFFLSLKTNIENSCQRGQKVDHVCILRGH